MTKTSRNKYKLRISSLLPLDSALFFSLRLQPMMASATSTTTESNDTLQQTLLLITQDLKEHKYEAVIKYGAVHSELSRTSQDGIIDRVSVCFSPPGSLGLPGHVAIDVRREDAFRAPNTYRRIGSYADWKHFPANLHKGDHPKFASNTMVSIESWISVCPSTILKAADIVAWLNEWTSDSIKSPE